MGAEMDFAPSPPPPPPEPARSPEPEELAHDHHDWKAEMMSAMGESVSFGRFLGETLDWGKWSAFEHNRYLEEAAHQSRPGSVAQKKAFFDAHYARKKKRSVDQDDEDIDGGAGLQELDEAGCSSSSSSCMTDEPAGEETSCAGSGDADVGGVVSVAPVEAAALVEEVEAIADAVGSSCKVGETTIQRRGDKEGDVLQVGVPLPNGLLQVQQKPEAPSASQGPCDDGDKSPVAGSAHAVEKQPLKESSIVNHQGSAESAKIRRIPMSSLLQKPAKFSSPPSGNKGMSSSAKRRSWLHSAKENTSPPQLNKNKEVVSSVPQKPSAMEAFHSSSKFTRCETGNAASSSKNLGSTIAERISQLECASGPVKDTQSEANQLTPPTKAFLKDVPEIALRTSQPEEQRYSHVRRVKEKLFGSTSPTLHLKTNMSKEKTGKSHNEPQMNELRQRFCFKTRPLPNFHRKNEQANDSTQQETTNLPNNHAQPISKGASKDRHLCCFPLRRG